MGSYLKIYFGGYKITNVLCTGYLTNTSIKFMAIVEDGEDARQPIRDSELKSLFVSIDVKWSHEYLAMMKSF